ncbi:MAG: hypothetical protein LAO22_17675 [Acidobacteriia bacterium]|nr:hypothetical protein [Terriglobia bacterium]
MTPESAVGRCDRQKTSDAGDQNSTGGATDNSLHFSGAKQGGTKPMSAYEYYDHDQMTTK